MKKTVTISGDGNPNTTKLLDEDGKPIGPVFALDYHIGVGSFGRLTLFMHGGVNVTAEADLVYPTDVNGLRLNALRGANVARLPTFKDAQGNVCHTHPLGFDWDLSKWMNAILGELGEAANIVKKVERGDFTLEEARDTLAKEFADVLCYLDLACIRAGIDLGAATITKFNEVSERVGSDVRLGPNEWFTHYDHKDDTFSYVKETEWGTVPVRGLRPKDEP